MVLRWFVRLLGGIVVGFVWGWLMLLDFIMLVILIVWLVLGLLLCGLGVLWFVALFSLLFCI